MEPDGSQDLEGNSQLGTIMEHEENGLPLFKFPKRNLKWNGFLDETEALKQLSPSLNGTPEAARREASVSSHKSSTSFQPGSSQDKRQRNGTKSDGKKKSKL